MPNSSKKQSEPTPSKSKQTKVNRGLKRSDYVVIALTIVLVSFGLWYQLLRPQTQRTAADICSIPGATHDLVVKADAFDTPELKLTQCDSIRVINRGSENYSLAFGTHEQHIEYPGFSQQMIRPNEFFTIDAKQTGIYRLHDHLRDKANVKLDIRAKL